jgi:hypothetical protein
LLLQAAWQQLLQDNCLQPARRAVQQMRLLRPTQTLQQELAP